MRRLLVSKVIPLLMVAAWAVPSVGSDRPFMTRGLHVRPQPRRPELGGSTTFGPGDGGRQLSKVQIERFRCTSSGDPATVVDMSCNTTELGQDFAPATEPVIHPSPSSGSSATRKIRTAPSC